MALTNILPLRVAQAVFTIIILGLTAYAVNSWTGGWYNNWSPSEENYLLFCSVWTIVALAYLIITPGRFEPLDHKFGILAVEVVTMIFWFAGWIALAVFLGDIGCGTHWGVCRASEAATVFAALEWLLFLATTIMACLHVYRTRDTSSGKHDPAMEVHTSSV